MIYRLVVNAFFDTLPPPAYRDQIKQYIKNHALTLNSGQPDEERSTFELHKCYHDQSPAIPCELIEEWQTT